jgi:hypothetical protein
VTGSWNHQLRALVWAACASAGAIAAMEAAARRIATLRFMLLPNILPSVASFFIQARATRYSVKS